MGNNINKLVTILEILKRKLNELKFKIGISYEEIDKDNKLIKTECMKVTFEINQEFLKINEEGIQSIFI
jgi:hypothetical protein